MMNYTDKAENLLLVANYAQNATIETNTALFDNPEILLDPDPSTAAITTIQSSPAKRVVLDMGAEFAQQDLTPNFVAVVGFRSFTEIGTLPVDQGRRSLSIRTDTVSNMSSPDNIFDSITQVSGEEAPTPTWGVYIENGVESYRQQRYWAFDFGLWGETVEKMACASIIIGKVITLGDAEQQTVRDDSVANTWSGRFVFDGDTQTHEDLSLAMRGHNDRLPRFRHTGDDVRRQNVAFCPRDRWETGYVQSSALLCYPLIGDVGRLDKQPQAVQASQNVYVNFTFGVRDDGYSY